MTAPETCPTTGKRQFATETGARRQLRAIRKGPRASKPGHETRYYLCPFCGRWHLTAKRDMFAADRARQAADRQEADRRRARARAGISRIAAAAPCDLRRARRAA